MAVGQVRFKSTFRLLWVTLFKLGLQFNDLIGTIYFFSATETSTYPNFPRLH